VKKVTSKIKLTARNRKESNNQ